MDYKKIVDEIESAAKMSLAVFDDDSAHSKGVRAGVEKIMAVIDRFRKQEERERDAARDNGATIMRKYAGARYELVDEIDGEDDPWVVARDGDELVFMAAREGLEHDTLDRGAAERAAIGWLKANGGAYGDCAVRFDLLSYEMALPNRAMARHHIGCLEAE